MSLRFGAYSPQTYLRRQLQRHTGALHGRKPAEVFARLQRNMSGIQNDWGNLIPSQDFVHILEHSILKASEEELLEIDKHFEGFEGGIPDQLAKAVEYRCMELKKSGKLQQPSWQYHQNEALYREIQAEMDILEYTKPAPLTKDSVKLPLPAKPLPADNALPLLPVASPPATVPTPIKIPPPASPANPPQSMKPVEPRRRYQGSILKPDIPSQPKSTESSGTTVPPTPVVDVVEEPVKKVEPVAAKPETASDSEFPSGMDMEQYRWMETYYNQYVYRGPPDEVEKD